MIEFIILVLLFVLTMGLFAFIYRSTLRQLTASQKQMEKVAEMLMAGSYQEWKRAEEGKPPSPNTVPEEPNAPDITENMPINLEEIAGVQVEGGPKKPIKIYG